MCIWKHANLFSYKNNFIDIILLHVLKFLVYLKI